MIIQYSKLTYFTFFVLIFVFCAFYQNTNAAVLYFSQHTEKYEIGATFSTTIYVSSPEQAINAVSGVVSFPTDNLEVVSLSKAGSIFSFWVQEPYFLNNAGTVNFEGVIFNPGFTGAGGKIITITFKAKAAGNAVLNFYSGSVLANDGKGTNVLTNLGSVNISIGSTKKEDQKKEVLSEQSGLPPAPVINSPTHPDSNKWYSIKDAKFIWDLPKNVDGVRLLVGKSPDDIPTVTYIPPIREKELTNLDDGIWYFSVRFHNSVGWGPVSRFRFQIDTKPPENFSIRFVDGKETNNPRPTVLFDTTDSPSGVAYYKVKVGEGNFFTVSPEIIKENPYILPPQNPGKKTILVQAFDKAENYKVAVEEFTIIPLEAPIIKEYPRQLPSGETLIIKGTTKYPNAQTMVWFEHEGKDIRNQIVRNDANGNFTLVAEEKLKDGIYKLWAEVVDERGARSAPSEKITLAVERPAFLKVGSLAVSLLAVVVPLVALIFILLFIIWYGWRKFSSLKQKILKDTKETEKALHQAFTALREKVEEQVAKLDGKPDLNEREKKICNSLKESLKISEEFINKEIKDIERKIKR